MKFSDYVRSCRDEKLIAPFEFDPAEVICIEVCELQVGPGSAVEDNDALLHCFEITGLWSHWNQVIRAGASSVTVGLVAFPICAHIFFSAVEG